VLKGPCTQGAPHVYKINKKSGKKYKIIGPLVNRNVVWGVWGPSSQLLGASLDLNPALGVGGGICASN